MRDSTVENDVLGDLAPPAVEQVVKPLLPQALIITGMKHIVSNAAASTHDHLAHWSDFLEELHILVQFLNNPDRRRRVVARCLQGYL